MTEPVRKFIWVPAAAVHPETNIFGRMWRTPDRVTSGKFLGGWPMGVNVTTVEWRFDSDEDGCSQ